MPKSFGFYIHIPFCSKKCPYCDFNSYTTSTKEVQSVESRYIDSLLAEAKNYKVDWEEQEIESIFLGGGTPSLFSGESIAKLLNGISQLFKIKENAEVTMEANPGSIYEPLFQEELKAFKNAGINRISLGCQSFSNNKLQFLGRIHSAEQSLQAIENVKAAGFDNFNIDLIFGVQQETLAQWLTDLSKAIALKPKHISAYALTIEPGTDFGKLSKKGSVLTGDDSTVSECYIKTQETLESAGYFQYEVSNYAKKDCECRHNLIYWSYKNYLGLGAGAHSFKDNKRWINSLRPELYMEQINKDSHARQREEQISPEQANLEIIYTCLRKATGIESKRFENLPKVQREIETLANEGLLVLDNGQIKLSKKGFLFSDHVVERLCGAL